MSLLCVCVPLESFYLVFLFSALIILLFGHSVTELYIVDIYSQLVGSFEEISKAY